MSRNQRLGVIVGAIVVLVVAFVLIRPTDDKEEPAPAPEQTKTSPTKTQTAEAKPKPPTVTIRDGKPAGGVKTIEFGSGSSARIDVTTDKPAEIHLHGYDIEKPVQPGKTTMVRFKADIEGIFELEDHDSTAELAKVKVSPQ
jgi:FtsP/CotA-like multicopper oxidase with cupredoxin domain